MKVFLALSDSSDSAIYLNMRAIYLDLLSVAVAGTQKPEAVQRFTETMSSLYSESNSDLYALRMEYSFAFDASTASVFPPMANLFFENVAAHPVPEITRGLFIRELEQLLTSMRKELGRIKLR